ncbi:MAG: hypothetical protein ABS894_00745 [Aerococcus urinaeequi]
MPYIEPDTGYYEPSEYDIMIDQLRATLMESVKQEHKDRMDRLEKENAELQEVKTRMQDIDREHRMKISELERAKSNVVDSVRRERLADLMKNLGHEIFGITYDYVYGEKCDNCDDDRYVHFKSPSGKGMREECECKQNRVMKFKTISHVTCEANVRTGVVWYRPYNHDSDSFVEDTSGRTREVVKDDENFEFIRSSVKWCSELSFAKEGRALEFCAWLNDQKLKEW